MLSSVTRYVFNYSIEPEKYKVKLDINDQKLNSFIFTDIFKNCSSSLKLFIFKLPILNILLFLSSPD